MDLIYIIWAIIILRLELSVYLVHLSVTEGQRKRFDLEIQFAVSLATER